MFSRIKEQMIILVMVSSIHKTDLAENQPHLCIIEYCSKIASDSSAIRTQTEIEIEIGIDSLIIESKMVVEIEIDKVYAPPSDRNVIPINPTAVKVDATCQHINASVKKMEDYVSIKEGTTTSAARINVVMMDCARVLPRENPVLLVKRFVVGGSCAVRDNVYKHWRNRQSFRLHCLYHDQL